MHGAFIALKALIPNPIKASIRKAIRDQLNGRGTNSDTVNEDLPMKSMKAIGDKLKGIGFNSATLNQDLPMKSMEAVNLDGTQSKIDSLRQNIDKMCNLNSN